MAGEHRRTWVSCMVLDYFQEAEMNLVSHVRVIYGGHGWGLGCSLSWVSLEESVGARGVGALLVIGLYCFHQVRIAAQP